MPEFQTRKDDFSQTRIVESLPISLADGDVELAIERFAFTANNITYAVMGEQIRYWQFFPTNDDADQQWGIIPVWGFAKVVASKHDDVAIGERLFGYFPPATSLKIKPVNISDATFFDGSLHRADLPPGYNVYRRVAAEPNYNEANDPFRMLLWPLHVTSFCIHDMLQESNWHGAEQVLVISASSKTSIGVGYALAGDEKAPKSIGITSSRNLEVVENLGLYDDATSYDDMLSIDNSKPTLIVDMSANGEVLSKLHTHLGDNMRFCLNVGATHWEDAGMGDGVITERSQMFFAPDRIQKRMKDWGPEGFNQRTAEFIHHTATQSSQWLHIKPLDGLPGLADIYNDVLEGKAAPDKGLIVEMI